MSNSCLDEKKFKKKCPPPMDCCGKDILFRKVIIPVAMGDDTQYPPENGAFRNALVEYEANHALYIYSSDGLYTKLSVPSGVTSVNGMYGDVTLDIPERVSQLINDLGFITKNADDLVNYTKTTNLAAVALSGSYNDLYNRPAINNGELTITRNGSALGSFKANQSQNVTMNVQVPTTTAELINNSQFVVDANYVHTDKNFTTALNNKLNHLAEIYEIGNNLTLSPSGRLDANVPAPTPVDSYYDASWVLTQAQATPEQYNELLGAANNNQRVVVVVDSEHYYVPEISADQDNIAMALSLNQPSGGSVNLTAFEINIASDDYNIVFNQGVFSGSQFVNELNRKANRSELATVALTGNYTDLNGAPTVNDGILTINENGSTLGTFSANSAFNETINIAVPTNTSELNNNSGFITLANTYYDASWLFEETTATLSHYIELKQAILDKKRIYLSQQNESYDALGKIYDDGTGTITVTITVGTVDSYNGTDYANDIIAMFEIDGTTKEITLSVGNTNGADFAQAADNILSQIPHNTSDLNNDSGFVTNTDYATNATGGVLKITNSYGTNVNASGELQGTVVSSNDYPSMWNDALISKGTLTNNYYDKPTANTFGGLFMPSTEHMTPIKTIEYDTASTTFYKICSFANNSSVWADLRGEALFRATITNEAGTIHHIFEMFISMKNAVNTYPYIMMRNWPGTSSASTTGVRYIRNLYPRALNNGANWDFEFQTYNASARHFKIEVFQADPKFTFYETLTATTIDSTTQNGGSTQLYTTDGFWTLGNNINVTVNSATSANYISSYLNKFVSGTLPSAGQAILAQQMVFLSTDNKFYPSTNNTQPIDPNTGVQLCSNAVNANAAVPASGLRQKYNNATLTNIPHATLTAGDRCFFRCTMDGSGNILSDNYVDTAMSPGYTWYYIGNATSATAINHDTTQSMFYTLDANGKLTHINGLEIA